MELERWHGGRRLIEIGILCALIAGAVVALPGLGELRDRIAAADPSLIALALVFELGSCLAFVAAFRGVFSRRLSWRFSYEVGMAEQAANVLLPTGGPVGSRWEPGRCGGSGCRPIASGRGPSPSF